MGYIRRKERGIDNEVVGHEEVDIEKVDSEIRY